MVFIYTITRVVAILLMLISVVLLVATIGAWLFNRASFERIRQAKKTTLKTAVAYFILVISCYIYGVTLVKKGELTMSSAQLIYDIAKMMHIAAIAFAATALIVVFSLIYSSISKKGNTEVLKKLLGNCVFISILFWIIAWLIA